MAKGEQCLDTKRSIGGLTVIDFNTGLREALKGY